MKSSVNKKLDIAVLCGGFQPERYGSILTGNTILRALKKAGFKNARRMLLDSNIAKKLSVKKPQFVFMASFNKWGEDGTVQGLLETLGIPYSGSGVEASAICKNKFYFSQFAAASGFHSPKTKLVIKGEAIEKAAKGLKFPLVVKPAHLGYSFGVSVVENKAALEKAIDLSFNFGTRTVVQEFIQGRELTIGVVEMQKGIIALPITELKPLKSKIFDTASKNDPESISETLPADLPKKLENKIKFEAVQLFKMLGCSGVSRFDTILDKQGRLFFLENNTCPGMVSLDESDLPKQLAASGISLEEYVTAMIYNGLNRVHPKIDIDLKRVYEIQ